MSINVQNENKDEKILDESLTQNTPKTEDMNKTVANNADVTDASGEQDFSLELIEQSMSNVSSGQIVDGTVVGVDEKEVLVDIGCKSEAAISINEFAADQIPAKGDTIKVYVVSRENVDGKPVLSKKKADYYSNLSRIKEAYKNDETITGKLLRRVRGGMIADLMGVETFLPGSQVGLKNVPNLDQFLNKDVSLKIIKLDEEKKSIVVSRKKVIENELESKKEKLKEFLQIDAELDGEVKNITDYGAFVDLGGIDGLLHITDMSWGRLNHPAEMLNIGDKIKVKVVGYDNDADRVALSIKQLVPHPWENIETKYQEGTKVTGKVVNVTKYGAFVELEPGVEGLVHISEMSWTKRVSNPKLILKEGDVISAIVLVVSKEKQRISLGLKQMQPNPWISIEQRYPIGTIVTRKIKNLTTFGAFVEIEPDIDGLVHISDISWTKRIYHPKEVFKKGDEVEAIILSVDKLLHRVSLGVKQLHKDPWEDLHENLPVNTEVIGKISKCIPKGILVDIPYNDTLIEGFVPVSHLAIPQIERTEDAFDVNEEINMKIIEIDIDNRRLILSVKAWLFSRDKNVMKEYQKLHLDRINESKINKKQASEKKANKEKKAKTKQDENYGYDDTIYQATETQDDTVNTDEVIAQPIVEETTPSEETT